MQLLKDRVWISSWYQDRVKQYGGSDPRSLGYNQRSSQVKRFEALSQLGDFDGQRLLDVGCGFGDFFAFLLERNITPDYMGLDLVPAMIDQCRQRYKDRVGPYCQFTVGDILDTDPPGTFDFVVASGIFGLLSENANERIVPTLQKLFSWCTTGLAVNFLSLKSERQDPKCLYVDPAALLTQALKLTPAVTLSHTYLPNDFTIYLYKKPAWEQFKAQGI
jgi:SAM-dependent methyltransferase